MCTTNINLILTLLYLIDSVAHFPEGIHHSLVDGTVRTSPIGQLIAYIRRLYISASLDKLQRVEKRGEKTNLSAETIIIMQRLSFKSLSVQTDCVYQFLKSEACEYAVLNHGIFSLITTVWVMAVVPVAFDKNDALCLTEKGHCTSLTNFQ